MRLVPGQEPAAAQAAVKAHLEHHAPAGVTLEFHYRPGGTRAFTLAADHPLRAAASAVLRREKGGTPAVTRSAARCRSPRCSRKSSASTA